MAFSVDPAAPAVRAARQKVCQLAGELAARGWLPATSGNLSVRVTDAPLVIAITASGWDKQHLSEDGVILVDEHGQLVEASTEKPSAETAVHTQLYTRMGCGAVLHVHTLYNNLASDLYFSAGAVPLQGYELLKALGHWEENARIEVPIVENHADLNRLAGAVAAVAHPDVPGVLVRNHGIYAWGRTPSDAKRHLEALEWLFEYHLLRLQYALPKATDARIAD
ncbi:methylthioribulose 1-phosphate dehydratase [Alicyclobacillus shizuokensis]|uniref:methylthioribulose 1-phosphate dehydratase n=1 Tax=Alicyclobacillus shizuokensis TaxID=392014 RepID=UPI00082E7E85|nr:methylthioribulose 1-phosphate dehydratase [Alicyclobacillus shizuokensis]MCL6625504.1 methylthioribulose 1-phosphate dehydratase [Alicyclobacillus shizuokensis]